MTPSMRWSCRVYATLLLLYPSTLRRQFGQEMIEVFADQMRDACQTDGWVGGMGVWSCVGREVLRTALALALSSFASIARSTPTSRVSIAEISISPRFVPTGFSLFLFP